MVDEPRLYLPYFSITPQLDSYLLSIRINLHTIHPSILFQLLLVIVKNLQKCCLQRIEYFLKVSNLVYWYN